MRLYKMKTDFFDGLLTPKAYSVMRYYTREYGSDLIGTGLDSNAVYDHDGENFVQVGELDDVVVADIIEVA